MADLISRAALLEDIKRGMMVPEEYQKVLAMQIVKDQPAIEAELVRHGRWIEVRSDPEFIIKDFDCSECGMQLDEYDTEFCYPGKTSHFYCPNCGAKMDLEE